MGRRTAGVAQGTYTIVVNLPEPATLAVGTLGECDLPAGWYAYTGSAFGPGGFARVDRHHRVATGENSARHWHVDYLLGDTTAEIASVARTVDADVECAVACAVADALDGGDGGAAAGTDEQTTEHRPVDGFGSSDCDCRSHLQYAPEREPLVTAVRTAHATHDPDRET